MTLLNWLMQIDTQLLVWFNDQNNNFFDLFFSLFTAKEIWYPVYLLMLFLILRKYKIRGIWFVLILIITIVLCDQISGILKDSIQRFRPSHEPSLIGRLNLPIGKRGNYGFVSSHAANAFGLAVVFGRFTRNRLMFRTLLLWAFITAYSRVYLGVHYPLDVICGGLLGALFGWLMLKVFYYIDRKILNRRFVKSPYWKNTDAAPILWALLFITITLIMVVPVLKEF